MKAKIPDLLKCYDSVFSKPQFNHFTRMIESLSICDKPSISRFSNIHNKSRSSLNRFLTESTWEVDEVKSIYHNQLNRYVKEDSYLLIDDTISHRPYAKKVQKANWHFDHTINKQSLGYSIVTSTLAFEGNNIPYDIVPYYRKEDCFDRNFLTKNDIVEKIIKSVKCNKNVRRIIFDTWYSNDQVIFACKEANKDYITQIKSNRNVTINHHKNSVRSFVRLIDNKDWEEFEHNKEMFRIFATSAFISKIRSIHLIFTQMYNKKTKKWGETHYVISNLMGLDSKQIIRDYLIRGGIESFHREAKQNTGLEGYFLRNNRGIERYLFLVMLAYSTLVLQGLLMKQKLSIGELCEENKIIMYEVTFEKAKRNPEMKETIFRGLAKARV